MTLKAESSNPDTAFREAVNATLRSVTKLGRNVAWMAPQSLPNDGKVIADERGAAFHGDANWIAVRHPNASFKAPWNSCTAPWPTANLR
jgi:hypothetical protein